MDRSGRVIDAVPECLDSISWVMKAHYRGEMLMARSYLCFRWLTAMSVKRPERGGAGEAQDWFPIWPCNHFITQAKADKNSK